MRKRVPFLLFGLGLSAALLNAQSIVPNSGFKNGMAPVTGATSSRAAEAKSATPQKYAKLPLSFERHGESEFVARGQGYAIDIRGARDHRSPCFGRFEHGRHGVYAPPAVHCDPPK